MKDENSFLHQANDYIVSFEYKGQSQSVLGLKFRESEYLHDLNRDFTRKEILGFIGFTSYLRNIFLIPALQSKNFILKNFKLRSAYQILQKLLAYLLG